MEQHFTINLQWNQLLQLTSVNKNITETMAFSFTFYSNIDIRGCHFQQAVLFSTVFSNPLCFSVDQEKLEQSVIYF